MVIYNGVNHFLRGDVCLAQGRSVSLRDDDNEWWPAKIIDSRHKSVNGTKVMQHKVEYDADVDEDHKWADEWFDFKSGGQGALMQMW